MTTAHISEEQLALYASADLPAGDSRLVREHLAQCPLCRDALNDFEWTRDLLANSLDDASEQELDDLRAGVMARVRARNRTARFQLWSVAAAACLALLCVFYVYTTRPADTPKPPGPEIARAILPQPRPKLLLPPVAQPLHAKTVHRRAAAGLRSVAFVAQTDGPPLLKLTTADPNVVIFLTSEERMQSNE